MTRQKKPQSAPPFLFRGMGVSEGYYPHGIEKLEKFVEFVEDLGNGRIFPGSAKEQHLLDFLENPRAGSTNIMGLTHENSNNTINTEIEFNVSYYDRRKLLLRYLPEIKKGLPDYKGDIIINTKPRILLGFGTIMKDHHAACDDETCCISQFNQRFILEKYKGKNKEGSTIKQYLTTDVITKKIAWIPLQFKTDNRYLVAQFRKTPYKDVVNVLERFRDFSYENCAYLKEARESVSDSK